MRNGSIWRAVCLIGLALGLTACVAEISAGGEQESSEGAAVASAAEDSTTTEATTAEVDEADDVEPATETTAGADADTDSTDLRVLPELGQAPTLLTEAVPDATVSRADETITDRDTYELTWSFDTAMPIAEACASFTAAAVEVGYVLERDDCEVDFDSRLTDGDDEVRFLGLDDRAILIYVTPSPLPLDEAVAINVPNNLTLPPLTSKWLERTTFEDRVEVEFVFDDDGDYLEHCEATVAELESQGFQAAQGCAEGSGTNLEGDGAYEVRVSSTDNDAVFYVVKIDREAYNEVVAG